jgi:hypothetical protein
VQLPFLGARALDSVVALMLLTYVVYFVDGTPTVVFKQVSQSPLSRTRRNPETYGVHVMDLDSTLP